MFTIYISILKSSVLNLSKFTTSVVNFLSTPLNIQKNLTCLNRGSRISEPGFRKEYPLREGGLRRIFQFLKTFSPPDFAIETCVFGLQAKSNNEIKFLFQFT